MPSLYAILDIDTLTARGLNPQAVCDAWLAAGVRLIQLRAKTMASGAFVELATRLCGRCRQAGAVFVVNDRADVAAMAGADGVHLGQEDLTPDQIRRSFREAHAFRVIGLSTHNLDQLRAGLSGPATYFAIGPVFATSSKAKADPVVGLAGVRAAADLLRADGRPLVAIGGVTLDRLPSVRAAGASSVAVIADLLTTSPGERAQEYLSRLGELPI